MSDPIQARSLLNAAQRDLTALLAMLNDNSFTNEVFGFHVQQATEKCFKAWLAALGETYPQSYGIDHLLKKLKNLDCDILTYENFLAYSAFAAQSQYASMDSDEISIERENVVVQVQSLHDRIDTILRSVIKSQAQHESMADCKQ